MASRRDELNAYTFAKRRLVAQFVQPNSTGSEESAPARCAGAARDHRGRRGARRVRRLGDVPPGRPEELGRARRERHHRQQVDDALRRPADQRDEAAPPGPQHGLRETPPQPRQGDGHQGRRVRARQREDPARRHPRHPVRARPPPRRQGGRRGQALGRVRAPRRRRPRHPEGGVRPRRPGEGQDRGRGRLGGGDLLYVEGPAPDRTRYVVDAGGTAYPVEKNELLLRQLVGQGRTPQRVSAGWLDTLHKGDEITFPTVDGEPSSPPASPGWTPASTRSAWSSPPPTAPGSSSTSSCGAGSPPSPTSPPNCC